MASMDPWSYFIADEGGTSKRNNSKSGICLFCKKHFKKMDAVRLRAHIIQKKGEGVSLCPCPSVDAINALSKRADQALAAQKCVASASGMGAFLSRSSDASGVGSSGVQVRFLLIWKTLLSCLFMFSMQ